MELMSALASVGLTGNQPGASTTGGAIDTAATRAAEPLTHSGLGDTRAVGVIWAVRGTAHTALTDGKSTRGFHLLPPLAPPRPLPPLAPPLPFGVFPEVHSWAPWELERHKEQL